MKKRPMLLSTSLNQSVSHISDLLAENDLRLCHKKCKFLITVYILLSRLNPQGLMSQPSRFFDIMLINNVRYHTQRVRCFLEIFEIVFNILFILNFNISCCNSNTLKILLLILCHTFWYIICIK